MESTETSDQTGTHSSPSTTNAPATTPTLEPFIGFSLPGVLITIDNSSFYQLLPGQTSYSIILSDGTMASITDQTVEIGGGTVSIPSSIDLSQNGGTEIRQLGSWDVEFSMRQYQQPPSECGSGTFDCFKQAAQTFINSAGSLRDSLGTVGASMVLDGIYTAWDSAGLAAEASQYAITAESISGRISSLLSPLEGAIESLDGAMSAANENLASFEAYEMQDLSSINKNIFPAYSTLRPALGSLRNINKILLLAIENPTGTLLTIARSQFSQMTAGLGIVSLTTFGLDKMASANVSSMEAPTNKTVESQDLRLHYLKFEQNFSLPLFHTMTKMFDGDAGAKTAATPFSHSLGPGYLTDIAVGTAKLMKYLPFISSVYLHPTPEEMNQLPFGPSGIKMGNDKSRPTSKGLPLLSRDDPSFHNKRFYLEGPGYPHQIAMSWQKGVPGPSQRYRRDESQGLGITIFVVDSGFDLGANFNGVRGYHH